MERGDRRLALLMLVPAFLLLGAVIVYPIGRVIWTSLFDIVLTGGVPARFVGLENYVLARGDPDLRNALANTLLITLVTVPGALLMGMGLALLADLPYRRRWPVRLALLIPWALPLAFTGLISAWFFNSQYGVVNAVLGGLGLPTPIWFNSGSLAMATICATIIWKASSFMALVLLAGLQTIPQEMYEAAAIDGASRWRRFRSVTLPMLQSSIVVALIFRTITSLQTFDVPYTMTHGGPGHSTVTLAMLIHQTTVEFLDLGMGATYSVLLVVISLAISAVYLRQIRRAA